MQDFLTNIITLAAVLALYFLVIKPRQSRQQATKSEPAQGVARAQTSNRKQENIFNRGARLEYTAKFPALADELNELREQFRDRMLAAGTPMQEINLLWNPIVELFIEHQHQAQDNNHKAALKTLRTAIEKARTSLPAVAAEQPLQPEPA